jgi:hypothetical protein
VVLAIAEFSRTISRFHQIMITLSKPCGHFRHFVKTVNQESRLKFWSKCLKWRFVPKRRRVADGWFDGVLSDDPRPFSHIANIGLVHEPFNTGRVQCDLSVDTSGVVGFFGPSGQSASDLFAMSVYQGNSWSIGDPSHLMAAHTRRVPLLPSFDKPAFSRIPQTFQP